MRVGPRLEGCFSFRPDRSGILLWGGALETGGGAYASGWGLNCGSIRLDLY